MLSQELRAVVGEFPVTGRLAASGGVGVGHYWAGVTGAELVAAAMSAIAAARPSQARLRARRLEDEPLMRHLDDLLTDAMAHLTTMANAAMQETEKDVNS